MAAYGSVASASGTGSAVVTKPSSLAAGDLMVAFVADRGSDFESGSPSTPSGWTEVLANAGNVAAGMTVYAKVADAGDASASDFTFTHSNGSALIAAVLYRITGTFASANNIYRSVITNGSESSSGVFDFTPGFTPDVASSVLLMGVVGYSAVNDFDSSDATGYSLETNSPTWTERADFTFTGGLRHRLSSASAVRTETTATGYYRITYTLAGSEDPSSAVGALLAIDDTRNGTATPSVISLVGNMVSPTPSGGGNVSVSAISFTSSVVTPVAAASDPEVVNLDKPSTATFVNPDKP